MGHTLYKEVICDISNIKGEQSFTGVEILYATEVKVISIQTRLLRI